MPRLLDAVTSDVPTPQPGPSPVAPPTPSPTATSVPQAGGTVLPTSGASGTGMFGQPLGLPPGGWAGVHGKARWSMLQMTKPAMFAGPDVYKKWLDSLPDDTTDTEYESLLDTERKRFTDWYQATYTQGQKPNVKDVIARWQAFAEGQGGAQQSTALHEPKSGVGPDSAANKSMERSEKQIEKRDLTQARGSYSIPTFKGRQISGDDIYTQGGTQDPYLQQFLTQNGIQLTGANSTAALRSGQYVLMGTEHSNELNANHDVYAYIEDAKAASMRVDTNKIAKYQASLGLIVTGKMDPSLLSLWYQAVEQAQLSTVAGMRMSVEEWFDVLATSAIAQKNGGGGGGGSQPLEATDYYRAMMQVLGDTSGVQG